MKKRILLLAAWLMVLFPTTTLAQKKIPILVYHSIAEFQGTGQKELYVTPQNFQKQMEYLKANGFTPLTFERWDEVGRIAKPIFITFDDGYKNNLSVATIFSKIRGETFQPAATLFVISDFIGRRNRLSKEDLRQLASSGMFSVQSHTANHPDLTKITNYEYELGESKKKIERITGRPVIAISYPYGNANQRVINETKKYYRFGLTTTPGPFVKRNTPDENYELPRTYVKYSTTLEEFARIAAGE
ncbi:polysaccharide deacetylase family protein [Neobacillus sp. YIM B06451]|uniref:polysaccharide deacetylase family protein n=1 Tax=Neobacillus sp. YIM B06451 TaxID=3070994 RepID=UPI00292E9D1B|nr:polysaccharide deacetylase family protein [Neobacillus sp. YIM B06451]